MTRVAKDVFAVYDRLEKAFDVANISKSNTCQYWAILGKSELDHQYETSIMKGSLTAENKKTGEKVQFETQGEEHYVNLIYNEKTSEYYLIDFGSQYYQTINGVVSLSRTPIVFRLDKSQNEPRIFKMEDDNIKYRFYIEEYVDEAILTDTCYYELNKLKNCLKSKH